jgi:UDP-N-acetylmuramyl tripeptide synthase
MSKTSPPPRKAVAAGKSKSSAAADINTFPNAVHYLLDRVDYERQRVVRYKSPNFKLDRMFELLEVLGNPHEQVKMVHVAGTVGKGSTCAMIANMLEGNGYRVGLFSLTQQHPEFIRHFTVVQSTAMQRLCGGLTR